VLHFLDLSLTPFFVQKFAPLKNVCLLLCVAGLITTFVAGCSTKPTVTLSVVRRTYDETKLIDYANGSDIEGQFININSDGSERLYFAYDPITDSGVDMERTNNGVVVWRVYIQPLGVLHFKYEQEVFAEILDGKIRVVSVGKGGFAAPTPEGMKTPSKSRIIEIRSLESGALISRKVD
jgi:hypothetical protein